MQYQDSMYILVIIILKYSAKNKNSLNIYDTLNPNSSFFILYIFKETRTAKDL